MNIETQALDNRQVKLTVTIDAETLEQFRRRAARKIAGQAKIPGFRPGKAPYEVILRQFGDAAIQQEAIELLVDDVYPKSIKEANLQVSGPGNLEEVVSLDPPVFVFTVPLVPEITLGEYQSLRKEYAPEAITDEQVEKTMLRLRRSYGTSEVVEHAAQVGELVSFKLTAKKLGVEEGADDTLISESSYQMIAGEEEDDEEPSQWPYLNFNQELIGVTAGESKTWTHAFGDGETVFEDMSGKEAEFTVNVESVKVMNMPEMDDAFAATLGEFETVADLQKVIREQLEGNYRQQYDQDFFNTLIGELVEGATLAYPPHLLDEEIEDFLHGVEHDLQEQRMDMDTYLKLRGISKEDFIEQEVKPAAMRRLERSLVLGEFAAQEKVQVQDEEVRAIYASALQQVKGSPEVNAARVKSKRSTQEIASSVASNAINNIFNQRLMARLKSLAMGIPAEAPQIGSLDTVSMQDLQSADAATQIAADYQVTMDDLTPAADEPATDEAAPASDEPAA